MLGTEPAAESLGQQDGRGLYPDGDCVSTKEIHDKLVIENHAQARLWRNKPGIPGSVVLEGLGEA